MSGSKELFYDWMGGNEVIFRAINDIRGDTYDAVMIAISDLGEHHLFPYYLAAIAAWVLLSITFKFIARKKGIGHYFGAWVGVFIVLISGYAVNGLAVKAVKNVFAYERPYVALRADRPSSPSEDTLRKRIAIKYSDIHVLEKMDEEKSTQSFPSGHVAFSVFMLVALWPVLSNGAAWFGGFFVALMCWSRISLGVHFPADVLGAILISTPLMMLVQGVTYKLLFKLFKLKC